MRRDKGAVELSTGPFITTSTTTHCEHARLRQKQRLEVGDFREPLASTPPTPLPPAPRAEARQGIVAGCIRRRNSPEIRKIGKIGRTEPGQRTRRRQATHAHVILHSTTRHPTSVVQNYVDEEENCENSCILPKNIDVCVWGGRGDTHATSVSTISRDMKNLQWT